MKTSDYLKQFVVESQTHVTLVLPASTFAELVQLLDEMDKQFDLAEARASGKADGESQ